MIKEEQADQIKEPGTEWRGELLELKQKKEITSVYSENSGLDTFSAGYISIVGNNDFIINHIHPTGRYDGYIALDIEDIILIERHTEYIKKIETLSVMYGKDHSTIEIINNSSFFSILCYASKNKKIVSIELINEELFKPVGFIKNIEEGAIKVTNINEYGEEDGESMVLLDDITKIQCDCEEEQILKSLWKSDKLNVKQL